MIVPALFFIAVGLIAYAGFLKLAASILRYSVSWKSSFLFAAIMLVIVIVYRVLVFSQPVAISIGQPVVVLVVLVTLGSWFFGRRGTDRDGAVLGWSRGLRLVMFMFVMMMVFVFAIALPIHIFLTNHLSPAP